MLSEYNNKFITENHRKPKTMDDTTGIVTPEMRTAYYDAIGCMAEDSDIQCWYDINSKKHPLSKEFKYTMTDWEVKDTDKGGHKSENNGGSTDYYKFKDGWKECGDIIEDRVMNYNQGNIFKSSFCFNVGRHDGTDYERELNKIIYFAQRELQGLNNE